MNLLLNISIIILYFSLINGQIWPIEILSFADSNTVLCAGGQFNDSSVVVPASCISGWNSLRVWRRIPTVSGSVGRITQVDATHIHPNFGTSDLSMYNIGIIQYRTSDEYNQYFQPRNLSKIPDKPAFCLLTGWLRRTQISQELLTDIVQVLPPSQCGSENPHIHCSIFPTNNHQSCRFILGTPLNCDNSTIAGIVLSENGCELRMLEVNGINTSVTMLRYTSMSLFEQWQNNGNYLKSSIIVVILGFLSAFVNFY